MLYEVDELVVSANRSVLDLSLRFESREYTPLSTCRGGIEINIQFFYAVIKKSQPRQMGGFLIMF